MHPEQLRAARAILNWSLDQLSQASGVHRNTLSNFETRRYAGDPGKLSLVKKTLVEAGVIFIDENGEAAGARLRRFRTGDRVRFRAQTSVRLNFNIAADDVGTVVEVEPHPPETGPTYKMSVQFGNVVVPNVFRFEYELVQASDSPLLKAFVERSGCSMLPNSHFVVSPDLDGAPRIETDLAKLPQELGSQIIVASADVNLCTEVGKRGFFLKEQNRTLFLMRRDFADDVLVAPDPGCDQTFE